MITFILFSESQFKFRIGFVFCWSHRLTLKLERGGRAGSVARLGIFSHRIGLHFKNSGSDDASVDVCTDFSPDVSCDVSGKVSCDVSADVSILATTHSQFVRTKCILVLNPLSHRVPGVLLG